MCPGVRHTNLEVRDPPRFAPLSGLQLLTGKLRFAATHIVCAAVQVCAASYLKVGSGSGRLSRPVPPTTALPPPPLPLPPRQKL